MPEISLFEWTDLEIEKGKNKERKLQPFYGLRVQLQVRSFEYEMLLSPVSDFVVPWGRDADSDESFIGLSRMLSLLH